MATQISQLCDQMSVHTATNHKLLIDNFEQWTRLAKTQMPASLKCRYKHSPI